MNNLTKNNEKYTTIKELTELYKVSDWTIREAIKKLFPEKLENGKTTFLSEFDVALIKDCILDNKRINLEFKHEVTTDADDMLIVAKAQQILLKKIEKLQNENEVMQPKAEFYDQICSSKTAIDISEVAKSLHFPIAQNKFLGRNQLFEILREEKILDNHNIPYQKYIDAGYFRTIEQKYTTPEGEVRISIKTVVYQKGVDFIKRTLNKQLISI